jgi:hypothetical protein
MILFQRRMSTDAQAEELSLDQEIHELQTELFRLKIDEKNLEIALKVLEERETIDNEFRNKS